MTTAQKIRKAKELVHEDEDGSTYLQSVCTVRELKIALDNTRRKEVKDIIQDAITIRKFNNKRRASNVA